jgi:hypothetical protein
VKVTINIDCTPDEARTFFGLPDVKPMQQAMLQEMEARMKKSLSAMDPESLFRMWFPASLQGLEQWQKFLWSKFGGSTPGEGSEPAT